jgi:hypothetical protein
MKNDKFFNSGENLVNKFVYLFNSPLYRNRKIPCSFKQVGAPDKTPSNE